MKNLTVVIADDDQLVLKDLKSIIDWNRLGFTIVATASSGEEALSAIEKYHPFLLITDIQMLGMNGLDVIENAHQKYPNMKFLVISSYDNFHYAQRAMASGVLDYLLKTEITPTTLTQKLIVAKDSFSRDNTSVMLMASQEFERFFTYPHEKDEIPSKSSPHLCTIWNVRYNFFVLGTAHDFLRNSDTAVNSYRNQFNIILGDIYKLATEYCVFPVIFCFKCFLIVGLAAKDVSSLSLLNFSNKLCCSINTNSLTLIQFYCKRAFTLSKFREYLTPIVPLLRYKLVFYSSRPVDMDTLKNYHYIPIEETFSFHSLIFDEEHLESDIMLMKAYIESCCNNYDLAALIHFFQGFCTQIEILTNNQLQLPSSLHADTPEFFKKWIYNTLNKCILLLTRGFKYHYNPTVDSVINFMKQNYSRSDLSSIEIASFAGLSVNRLGVVFKKETGKTLNEYLAKVRVDKAIELLEKTDLKIYEIAEKCGYKSSQYFSQFVFQKTGKKPLDYRRGKIEEK